MHEAKPRANHTNYIRPFIEPTPAQPTVHKWVYKASTQPSQHLATAGKPHKYLLMGQRTFHFIRPAPRYIWAKHICELCFDEPATNSLYKACTKISPGQRTHIFIHYILYIIYYTRVREGREDSVSQQRAQHI